MTEHQNITPLLALDAGVRETGWAIFRPEGARILIETGAIGTATRRRLDAGSRVGQLIKSLDLLLVFHLAVTCLGGVGSSTAEPRMKTAIRRIEGHDSSRIRSRLNPGVHHTLDIRNPRAVTGGQ